MKISMQTLIFLVALAGFCQGLAALAQNQGPPPLSEEQRDCLDKLVGKPGSGEPPPHEKMDAAFKACNVPPPPGPPPPPPAYDADKNAD